MHLAKQFWAVYISAGIMAILLILGTVLIVSLVRDVSTASAWNRHTQQVIALHNATRTRSGQAYADLQLRRDPSESRSALIDALDGLREMVRDNPTQYANAGEIKEATLFRFTALDTKSNEGVSTENLNRANTKFADTEMALMIQRESDYTAKEWRTLVVLLVILGMFVTAFALAIYSVYQSLMVRQQVADKIEGMREKNGYGDILAMIKGARSIKL